MEGLGLTENQESCSEWPKDRATARHLEYVLSGGSTLLQWKVALREQRRCLV